MSDELNQLWTQARLRIHEQGLAELPAHRPDVHPLAPPRTVGELAQLIDETLLRPDATFSEVDAFLAQARSFPFRSVCVQGCHVSRAVAAMADTNVLTAAVIGFPHGGAPTSAKAIEAEMAVDAGARELDMVIAVGTLKSQDLVSLLADIRAVRQVAPGVTLKVILETSLLSPLEMAMGAMVAELAGANLVKTSTGFAQGGATGESVRILRAMVGPQLGVKASGGIRSLAELFAMVAAGASRIGTSRGHALCAEFAATHGGIGSARP